MEQKTDKLLMDVLEERKTLTGFFDAVFGFLRRHSDFYHTKTNEHEEIGFYQHARNQIVNNALRSYEIESEQNLDYKYYEGNLLNVVNEEVVESVEKSEAQAEVTSTITTANSDNRKEFLPLCSFVPSEYKNGACFEKYCWTQTPEEIEVYIKLPANITTAKHLNVQLKSDRILIVTRVPPIECILNGELSHRVKHNDALWSVSNGKLQISFDKIKRNWWYSFLLSESAIDPESIDYSTSVQDLSESAQMALEKLQVNSKNSAAEKDAAPLEALRQAWNMEGSPFKGQPFDVSMLHQ